IGGAILGRIWPSVMQFAGVVALAEAAEPAALSRSGVSAGAWVRMARSVLPASSAPAIMTRSTAARAATRRNTIRTLERRSSHEVPQAPYASGIRACASAEPVTPADSANPEEDWRRNT